MIVILCCYDKQWLFVHKNVDNNRKYPEWRPWTTPLWVFVIFVLAFFVLQGEKYSWMHSLAKWYEWSFYRKRTTLQHISVKTTSTRRWNLCSSGSRWKLSAEFFINNILHHKTHINATRSTLTSILSLRHERVPLRESTFCVKTVYFQTITALKQEQKAHREKQTVNKYNTHTGKKKNKN